MLAYRLLPPHLAAVGASIAGHAVVALGLAVGLALHRPAVLAAPPVVVEVALVDAAELLPTFAPSAPAARQTARTRMPPGEARAPSAVATAHSMSPPSPSAAASAAVEASQSAQAAAPQPVFLATGRPTAQPAFDPLVEYRRRVWDRLAANAPMARPGAGVAVAIFAVDEAGSILFVRLRRSSGDPLFDRACLKAIRDAAPLPAPPPGTSRDDLVFELPIKTRTS